MSLKHAAFGGAIFALCGALDPAPAAAQAVNCGDLYARVMATYRVAPLSPEYNQMAAYYAANCLAGSAAAAPAYTPYPQYYYPPYYGYAGGPDYDYDYYGGYGYGGYGYGGVGIGFGFGRGFGRGGFSRGGGFHGGGFHGGGGGRHR
jgi:hypothetical protein